MKYTKTFAENMYKTMGVRFLFLVAFETPGSNLITGALDFNDTIGGGKSYTDEFKQWRTEGIDLDDWSSHNADFFDATKIPEEVRTKKFARAHLQLKHNEYGEPILPNPILIPQRETARTWRQNVVRAFLSMHYSERVFFYLQKLIMFNCFRTGFWEQQTDSVEKVPSDGPLMH